MKPGCKKHDGNDSEELVELLTKVITKFHKEIKKELKQMAQNLQDVLDAVTAVDGKVEEVATKLADLSTDFDAAVQKLQDAIAAGSDTTPAVAGLAALVTKLSAVSDTLSAIDVKAETISGNPTPPVA